MVLERADCPLCSILTKNMWWYQLVVAAIVGDGLQECGTGFIVKYVGIGCCVTGLEVVKQCFVCCYAMGVILSLEGVH